MGKSYSQPVPRVNAPRAADLAEKLITRNLPDSDQDVTQQIGVHVAAARRRAGLTLAAVAAREGVSPAHLSQIESGLANPTVRTLAQVARALDADVATLFGAAEPVHDARFAPRVTPLPVAAERGGPPARYDLSATGADRLAVRLLHDDLGDHAATCVHAGEEVVVVLRGEGTLEVDGARRALATGTVAHLAAGTPHRLEAGPGFLATVVFTA